MRTMAFLSVLTMAACESALATEQPALTRLEVNEACIGCHEAEAQQWAGSLHNRSWTDASFAHAYRNEPSPFCWACHAPESEADSEPAAAAVAVGVTCVSCHVEPSGRGVRPAPGHAALVRPDDLTTLACGRCHEFGFESTPSLLMQSTLSEHQSSPFAGKSCASCHMKSGSHTFAITRTPSNLATALDADAERDGDTVRLRLRSRGVGHAFPTGDTFRVLHVEVGREGRPASAETRLRRVFALERAQSGLGFALEQIADTRLAADGSKTTLELSVPASGSEKLWWRVVYERRDNPFKASPHTFERIELAGGLLEPEADR